MEVERKKVNVGAIKEANLPIIWVLGGPGSGKGSQCLSMVAKHGFTHLSSGDLLRKEVLSGSNLGRQLYRVMELGELVPTTVVLDLLAEAMVNEIYTGKAKGFLLDNFPMNLEEAEAFESYVTSPTKLIYLSAEQDVMIGRLLERGNFDDTKEAIEKRCANFQNQTRPVLAKYEAKLVKVNADQPKDKVAEDIASGAAL